MSIIKKITLSLCLLFSMLLFSILMSLPALASQCLALGSTVDAREGFCFSFTIDSDGTNRARLEGSGGYYYPFWTDDWSYYYYGPAIFDNSYVSERRERTFQVKFVRTSNYNANKIKGRVEYYVDGILEDSIDSFNLTSATGADKFNPYLRLNLVGNQFYDDEKYCVTQGECALVPDEPDYSLNAQYKFGVASCSGGSCTINYKNMNFELTPLVFVMPTISTSSPDDDRPATLAVTSVSNESATIVQQSDSRWFFPNNTPMTEVSYLVIEPGVANFGGQEVIAGYVETNRIADKSGAKQSSRVQYADFGQTTAFSTPVVLHQIQSQNNGNRWMTSGAKNSSNTRVDLFLELSASKDTSHNYQAEKVGFVATSAVNGLSVDNYTVEFNASQQTVSQSNYSFWSSCNNLFDTRLSTLTGILINKQERAGSHGGWLRRCKSEVNQFSVVVDEDHWERSHIPEKIGYFAFEEVAFELPDVCPYFPKGLLSNQYFNGKPWASPISLSGHRNIIYLEDSSPLSFTQFSASAHSSGCKYNDNGEVTSCAIDSDLAFENYPVELPEFETDITGINVVSCTNGCKRTIKPNKYTEITIGNNNSVVTLEPGEYWVSRLSFSSNDAKLALQGDVVLHYQQLFIGGDRVDINYGSPHALTLIGHGSKADILLNKNQFSMKASVYIDPLSVFGVRLLGSSVEIEGAIAAPQVLSTNNDVNIRIQPLEGCGSIPSQDYTLELSPIVDIALTCEDLSPLVRVLKDGVLATDFSGRVNLEYSDGSSGSLTPIGGEINQSIVVSSDVVMTKTVTAYIAGDRADTEQVGTYEFVPYRYQISSNPTKVIANKPASFTITPLECSANGSPISSPDYEGKETLQVTARQYDTPNNPTDQAEIEVKDRNDNFVVVPTGSQREALNVEFLSVNGVVQASSEVVYPEAGAVSYSLVGKRCIENENGDEVCKEYQGSHSIHARPWTFAICDPDDRELDGNIVDADSFAFAAAGENFDLHVKPIRWKSGDADSDPELGSSIIASPQSLCNQAATKNFFDENAPEATIELTFDVAQPSDGESGEVSGDNTKLNTDKSSEGDYLDYAPLSWSEVGVLNVKADTTNNYLGMNINQSSRSIGRFYPSHFEVVSPLLDAWDYRSGQLNFAYMSQPLAHSFKVEAQNTNDDPTLNYSSFSTGLISDIRYLAVDENSDEWGDRIANYGSLKWDGTPGQWNEASLDVTISGFEFLRKVKSASPLETSPDGPFDKGFGLFVSDPVDGADFIASDLVTNEATRKGKSISTQPEFRYGRMTLGDVGGTSEQNIAIPLRVEYWDDSLSQFTLNSNDSASEYISLASHTCKQTLWADPSGSSSALQGASSKINVDAGKENASSDLSAKTGGVREQVRFWIRLDDLLSGNKSPQVEEQNVTCGSLALKQPWLQYNWFGRGDEDPSSTVTFGIFRGNDRVIYRGEPGLVGN